MRNTKIYFRADGNAEMGLGHIYRSISLISFLSSRFECIFLSRSADAHIKSIVPADCKAVFLKAKDDNTEIEELSSILTTTDILVLDGYQFGEEYQKAVRSLAGSLVAVDDKAAHRFYADVIINHGDVDALPQHYQLALPGAEVCGGIKYLMLRKEFLDAAKLPRRIDKVDTVLICIGATDSFGVSEKIVDACLASDFICKVHLVQGVQTAEDNRKWKDDLETGRLMIHTKQTAIQMVSLIRSAQIMISTASTIGLEGACVKTGLICGTVVDNQEAIYSELEKNQCCFGVGRWQDMTEAGISAFIASVADPEKIKALISNQSKHIDGRSPERLLEIFDKLANV